MCLGLSWFVGPARAGGSGLNTFVVVNQNSSNSLALGNYFLARRQIPPGNLLHIAWSGGNTTWDAAQFQSALLQPLLQAISARGLTNQIHYVVLSMDIPYLTTSDTIGNGTTSALFYGLKSNIWPGTVMMTNSYFASEAAFPDARPSAALGYSFLATMLTGNSLAEAKRLVDQGVNSDATFPNAPVLLANTTDPYRRIRTPHFDNAIFNTRLRADYRVVRTNANSPYGLSGLLGYQTGLQNFSISPGTFVPGAMADSLTSYGGVLFGHTEQTTLLAFIGAGAAGSYGTVSEPLANVAKFPNPQNYFYQARGFTLAECYYQSLSMPYQGLVVGEPLAAPFAKPGSGTWITPAASAGLSGTSQLTVHFTAADPTRPLQRVDLFVDGKYSRTLTNIVPTAGNLVKLRLNGQNLTYPVPANATLNSIAAGVVDLLNAPAVNNLTRSVAQAFGDRIELRYLGTNRPPQPQNLRIGGPGGSAPLILSEPAFGTEAGGAAARTVFLHAARATFLDTAAFGRRTFSVTGTASVGSWLRLTVTKTNGVIVQVAYTNQVTGATAADVLLGLFNRINATPALQEADGVQAEDFTTIMSSQFFSLLPRQPGLPAAGITAMLSSSSAALMGSPPTPLALNANLPDLQPRNHLYLTTGAEQLKVTFALNTTELADGYHELTAVAYEGSHVRTPTRISLPVRVQNTPLTAQLELLSPAATNSISVDYSFRVAANLPGRITLFSTGGEHGTVTNQAVASFSINGTALGEGAHPVWAEVQDAQGRRYRTDIQVVRLIAP